jgi:hypothetical protein
MEGTTEVKVDGGEGGKVDGGEGGKENENGGPRAVSDVDIVEQVTLGRVEEENKQNVKRAASSEKSSDNKPPQKSIRCHSQMQQEARKSYCACMSRALHQPRSRKSD